MHGRPAVGTRPRRSVLLPVAALAAGVGLVVSLVAGFGAASDCGVSPVDAVCLDLTRTLAERMGVAAGLATAVVVLTMVGLARLAASPDHRGAAARARGRPA